MTSNAQFAFKKCHSTNICTALVKEVVSYCNERNTNVYACLLDATEAFDCLRYDKLFQSINQSINLLFHLRHIFSNTYYT